MTDGDADEVQVCPECESTSIQRRSWRHADTPASTQSRWVCRDCEAAFREAASRPGINGGNTGLNDLQQRLLEADPDKWPAGGDD